MLPRYRKMAARSNSDLFREVTEAVCNGWKSSEIQNLQHKLLLFLQDEVSSLSHCSSPSSEVCNFSIMQFPDCQKLRSENRKPVKYVFRFHSVLFNIFFLTIINSFRQNCQSF